MVWWCRKIRRIIAILQYHVDLLILGMQNLIFQFFLIFFFFSYPAILEWLYLHNHLSNLAVTFSKWTLLIQGSGSYTRWKSTNQLLAYFLLTFVQFLPLFCNFIICDPEKIKKSTFWPFFAHFCLIFATFLQFYYLSSV